MSAKEFLRSVRRMDELIDRKQRQLERLAELRAQAESCTVALSPDKVQTSGRNSADQMAHFTNQFDKVCTELGTATNCYCCTHCTVPTSR